MKAFLFRFLFVLLLVLLQLSLFDILFPSLGTPVLVLVSVVAWVSIEGFFPALRMTLPLTLLFEILASDRIGILSVYAILLAYATSFLSKRVHIEQYGYGLFSFAVVAAFGAWGYRVFETLVLRFSFTPLLQTGNILFSIVSAFVLFFPSYYLIRRFERSIDLSDQKQMQHIR